MESLMLQVDMGLYSLDGLTCEGGHFSQFDRPITCEGGGGGVGLVTGGYL